MSTKKRQPRRSSSNEINVYLEAGKKRTFAGALEWPGWCRSGRDESSALQALFDYAIRYARVMHGGDFPFQAPDDISAFIVLERLEGNGTTDFGAPAIAPSNDEQPVNAVELQRLEDILKACWQMFDATAKAAAGKSLRTGPRGGGRQLEAITQHVLGAEAGYLSQLGWKLERGEMDDTVTQLEHARRAILKALGAAARGEIPARGPRGGLRWTPRYFVRRAAWHVLDHAWEIEDRTLPEER